MKGAPALLGMLFCCCLSLPAADRGKVDLRATERAPGAKATAVMQSRNEEPEIQLTIAHLQPATLFGGDFNTYIAWVVSPGRAANAGEVLLDGDSAQLRFAVPRQPFGILVTAEPHYLVDTPSRFVVLESPGDHSMSYRAEATPYNFRRDTLEGLPAAKNKVVTDVRQAISAMRLARRAGARTGCSEFSDAQQSLEETLRLARVEVNSEKLRRQARETVRLAVLACREE